MPVKTSTCEKKSHHCYRESTEIIYKHEVVRVCFFMTSQLPCFVGELSKKKQTLTTHEKTSCSLVVYFDKRLGAAHQSPAIVSFQIIQPGQLSW